MPTPRVVILGESRDVRGYLPLNYAGGEIRTNIGASHLVYSGRRVQSPRASSSPRGRVWYKPARRWDAVGWRYSLIFVAAVVLIGGRVTFGLGPDKGSPSFIVKVSDQSS